MFATITHIPSLALHVPALLVVAATIALFYHACADVHMVCQGMQQFSSGE
jgi:hypothetical protein